MDPVDKHCHCPAPRKQYRKKSAFPVLTGILIAIIPKCPFCILAYSSAMTLCSGAKMYDHAPTWTSYISIGLAALTLGLVLYNYRGRRTWIAAAMVIAGSLLIVRSELVTGQVNAYYLGTVALIGGVWVNASFYYFYRQWIRPLFRFLGLVPEEKQRINA